MAQNPLAAVVAENPSNALVLLKVSSDGALITTSDAGGDAVTIADGADVAQGHKADAAAFGGSASIVSLLKGQLSRVAAPYATVAASQTKQLLGATGAIGDSIARLVIVPATTSPGIVEIYDSSGGTAIVLFAGGATSVANIAPFAVPLGMISAAGGWYVTTGANVSVVAVGNFT